LNLYQKKWKHQSDLNRNLQSEKTPMLLDATALDAAGSNGIPIQQGGKARKQESSNMKAKKKMQMKMK
jgi:hypothetical protein